MPSSGTYVSWQHDGIIISYNVFRTEALGSGDRWYNQRAVCRLDLQKSDKYQPYILKP